MAVRLQIPKGGAFSFNRQMVVAGVPLDLTGATLVAKLWYSADDEAAGEDPIATLSLAALVEANGTVVLAGTGANTASLDRGIAYYFRAQATKAGVIYRPENCHGQVILTPLDGVLAGCLSDLGITETLTPAETPTTYDGYAAVINRSDITALTGGTSSCLDAIVTADSVTYPVNTIVILSYGLVSQIWKLVAGTDAEAPTATPAIVRPDDYNASTNAVVWKQIG